MTPETVWRILNDAARRADGDWRGARKQRGYSIDEVRDAFSEAARLFNANGGRAAK